MRPPPADGESYQPRTVPGQDDGSSSDGPTPELRAAQRTSEELWEWLAGSSEVQRLRQRDTYVDATVTGARQVMAEARASYVAGRYEDALARYNASSGALQAVSATVQGPTGGKSLAERKDPLVEVVYAKFNADKALKDAREQADPDDVLLARAVETHKQAESLLVKQAYADAKTRYEQVSALCDQIEDKDS